MSKTGVILSGGPIDEKYVLETLECMDEPLLIGVDHGVKFLYENEIVPDYIVGDFDSLPREIVDYYRDRGDVPIREFNPVKDASDTEIAIRFGITLGCQKLIVLGGTGARIDHMWANVQSLAIPLKAGVEAEIRDPLNRIYLANESVKLKKDTCYGPYFSLFPLGETVYGLTISGAKYPLEKHDLTAGDSLCVSNEFSEDEVEISFAAGTLVIMETRDRN